MFDTLKKKGLNAALALVSVILCLSVPVGLVMAQTLFENWEGPEVDSVSRDSWEGWWQGFTFTAESNHTVTSMEIMMFRRGSPGTATVSIWNTDVDGLPTGSALASATFDGNSLPEGLSNAVWQEIIFTSPCTVHNGSEYAILLIAHGNNWEDAVCMRVDNSSPTYTGGCQLWKYGSDDWEVSGCDSDSLFRVYGEVALGGEAYSLNKASILAPWLAALVIVSAVAGIVFKRRRVRDCR